MPTSIYGCTLVSVKFRSEPCFDKFMCCAKLLFISFAYVFKQVAAIGLMSGLSRVGFRAVLTIFLETFSGSLDLNLHIFVA